MAPLAATAAAAAALLAVRLAAAAPAAPQLSAIIENGPNAYQLVRVGDDGSLTPVLKPAFGATGIMSGVTAPCAGAAVWWTTPPFEAQAALGLYLLNVTAGSTASVALVNPAGAPGEFVVGEMTPSDVPGDALGLLAPKVGRAWMAVAELSPAGGAPRVRANLSAEGAGFEQIAPSFSAFDASSRTLYFAAAVDGKDLLFAAPLDGPANPAALWNTSITFDALALAWAGAIDTVVAVGLVAPPQTWGMRALDRATGAWRDVITWSNDTFFLSGLGQVAVDPSGRFVAPVVSDAAGHPTMPVVDVTTGAEVRRITVKAPATMIVDVGYV